MKKTARARYTLEFKQEAVRLVEGGQGIAAAARSLGVVEQTLFNWIKARREGNLRREAKDEIIDWLLWYNHARLHSTLAYVSPVQFEQDWSANQPRQANS